MRKIGIFTAYPPYVKLSQEGLGRLMVFIMKGMVENGDKVTILAPSWHRKEIKELLKEQLLEKTIKIRTMRYHAPVLLLIYQLLYYFKHRERKEKKRNFWADVVNFLMSIVYSALSSYSFILFTLQFIVLMIIGIPILIIVGLYAAVRVVLQNKWVRKMLKPLKIVDVSRYIRFIPQKLKGDALALGVLNTVRKYEIRKMVKFVNKSDIEYWYIPNIFWNETLKIKKKRSLVAPDVVYADFPNRYSPLMSFKYTSENIDDLLSKQPKLVCYSNYVAEQHLAHLRDVRRANIQVIPHGAMELSEHLTAGLSAKEIVEAYLRNPYRETPNIEYVRQMRLAECDFLFYSSQYRYHKNVPMLLNVLARLIREEKMSIKLVLTCANYWDLEEMVEKLNLSRDVIFLPRVPEAVLAGLNGLARLHVNPSLFEGAFPFTFTESVSCGTPSVMADIPVSREIVTDEELRKMMFFDPYDEDSMMERIKWALAHRDELLAAQLPLFEKIKQRSWADVAEEYVQSMRYFTLRKMPKRRRRAWKRKR
ncbi:MAG: glycosyltransferase family 4 protein [Lentisphaerae bacterium]|nr:glycosyltransferase family 4 protein [Lentisphaerota bacterium]